jgi:hypothetical protein
MPNTQQAPRTFRCIYAVAGGHVHTTIFCGYPGQTFARLGSLTFNTEEFCDFRRVAEDGAAVSQVEINGEVGPVPVAWEFIKPITAQDIRDEEAQEEAANNGQFGVGL